MTTLLDKRIINLASSHGILVNGSYKSNVSFSFPNLLRPEPDIAYVEVGVVSAEIPVSFYTINELNSRFEMDLYLISTGFVNNYVIDIPYGNYTANTLITQIISSVREAVKVQIGFPDYSVPNLVIQISKSTGKLTWLFPDNADWSKMVFDTLGNQLLKDVYGWTTNEIDLDKNVPVIAPQPLNLLGVNKINIGSNYLSTYNYDSNSSGFSNILASIEVNASPYGIILYRNQSLTYNILRVPELDSFSIQLRDSNNNFLNMNNQDWTITLGMNIYRYMPQFSKTTFQDVLGIKPPQPPTDEKPPRKDEPIIKNDLDLLTYQ